MLILNKGKIFLLSIAIAVVFSGTLYLCSVVTHYSDQYITGDNTFSKLINVSIKNLLGQNIGLPPAELFAEIKSNFPMVDSIKIQRIGLNKAHINIIATDLAWSLGSNFVLTQDASVFLANSFSQSLVDSLPQLEFDIMPESVADVGKNLKSFLLEIPDFIIEGYNIKWYSSNEIILINKQKQNQKILVRQGQELTPALIETANRLFSDYQRHANKLCLGEVKADVRFNRQIIVSC